MGNNLQGVGKPTLLVNRARALANFQPAGVHHPGDQGVWRKERVQTGKLFGNRTKILAHVALQRPHRVGKYSVDSAGFEEFLHEVPVFSRGSKLIVMDEIGKMECISPIFRKDHSADPRFRPAVHCHHCEERSALH